MPNLLCCQCETLEKVSNKNWKLYSGHGFEQVCSVPCFFNWITCYDKYKSDYNIWNDQPLPIGDVWSEKAKMFFRSEFEKDTAEFFLRHRIKFFYEVARFRVGNSIYVPDFYLIHWHKFVEVKGMWGSSAKTKYRNFSKLYPDVKILLLDWRHHNNIKEG